MKAVTIEQYHSCTIDDDSLDDEQEGLASIQDLHSQYSLNSNCFSIEVLVEVEDALVSDDAAKERVSITTNEENPLQTESSDGKQPKTPGNKTALHIRWRAGVVFSRDTILKAQIERGALEGHFTSLAVRRGSIVGVDTPSNALPTLPRTLRLAASGDVSSGRDTWREARSRLLPRTFALESWAVIDTWNCSSQAMAAATAAPFFESIPEEFAQVLEENMGSKVTASLFFEALLSDACSFFRPAHADSGNMEVDISAWRAIVASGQSRERTNGFIRKQVFRMPLSGIPGVEVAQVEDFQYYALIKARSQDPSLSAGHNTDSGRGDKRGTDSSRGDKRGGGSHPSRDRKRPPSGLSKDPKTRDLKPRTSKRRRLEFGMKLFVPALPEGSQFSIEVLAIVEPADDDSSDNVLRILFASPPRHRQPETRGHAVVNPHVVAGVLRGLKQIWKQVAHTMMEICETNSDYVVLPTQLQPHTSQGLDEQELYLLQQSRANPNLPTHDELASRVIEAIAAVY
ncbi:hypothetical protein GQ600_16794 [Phytophthora cactorum]|nr:hypothetical protein GQ600_16794 [Phytophthora cactorum]